MYMKLPLAYEHEAHKSAELPEVLSGIEMLTGHAGRKSTLSTHPKTHTVKVHSGASLFISVVTLLAILTKCHRVLSCLQLLVCQSLDCINPAEQGELWIEFHPRWYCWGMHLWIRIQGRTLQPTARVSKECKGCLCPPRAPQPVDIRIFGNIWLSHTSNGATCSN